MYPHGLFPTPAGPFASFSGGAASPSLTGSTPTLIATSRPGSWYSPLTDQAASVTYVSSGGFTETGSGSATYGPGESLAVALPAATNVSRTFKSAVTPLAVWCVVDFRVTTWSGSATEDSVMAGLFSAAGTWHVCGGVNKATSKAFVEVRTAGGTTTRTNIAGTATLADGDYYRVVLIGGVGTGGSPSDGCWVQVYRSTDGSTWTQLTNRLSVEVDVRVAATLAAGSYGLRVTMEHSSAGTRTTTLAGPFTAGYYGGSGVQNLSFVLDDRGEHVRHADGRYYVAHTVGGRNGADPGLGVIDIDRVSFICQGVGLWDAATNTLTQTALLFVTDGTRTVGHTPASITKHRAGCGSPYAGKWVCMISGWGRANGSTAVPTLLAIPDLSTDVLSGVHVLSTTSVTPPVGTSAYDWSCVVWEDDTLWAACVTTLGSGPSSWLYYPAFATGGSLTAMSAVAVDYGYGLNAEGLTAYRAGGELRYVAAGLDRVWREYRRDGTPVGQVDGAGLFSASIASHLALYPGGGVSFDTDTSPTLAGGMAWSHGNVRKIGFAGGSRARFVAPSQAVDEVGLTPLAWVRADASDLCVDRFGVTPATAGQTVYSWNDRTGRIGPRRGLVQHAAGDRPTARAGYLESSAGKYMIGNAAVVGGVLLIAVVRWDGTGAFSRVCSLKAISELNDFSGPKGCVLLCGDSGNWLGYHRGSARATVAASVGSYQIVVSRWTGTTHTLRIYGGASNSVTVPTMALDSAFYAIGWDGVDGTSAFRGELAEKRLYSGADAPSDAQLDNTILPAIAAYHEL